MVLFQTNDVEKIKTRVLCSQTIFFFFENRAVYELMGKHGRFSHATEDNKIRCGKMQFACHITKAGTQPHADNIKHL